MHIAQPPQTEQRKTLAISAFDTHFVSCVLHDCPMAAVHPCKRLETTYHFALIPSWFGFFSSSSSSRFRVGLVNCIPNIVDDVVNDRVFVVRTNELCVCVCGDYSSDHFWLQLINRKTRKSDFQNEKSTHLVNGPVVYMQFFNLNIV